MPSIPDEKIRKNYPQPFQTIYYLNNIGVTKIQLSHFQKLLRAQGKSVCEAFKDY
tara:strand:- start:840 stop:1004 length:165 start_codon:yes stop_codon:yes gene_type:complete